MLNYSVAELRFYMEREPYFIGGIVNFMILFGGFHNLVYICTI